MILDLAYRALRPALLRVDPETAHALAIRGLRTAAPVLRAWPFAAAPDDPILATHAFGLAFANPIGLAAGFDKHAEATDALGRLGFGHVEIGGVTPRPQAGNPRPRLFRLPADRAVINRYGLNSHGLAVVARRLAARRRGEGGPIGANLGKNKETTDEAADYVRLVEGLAPLVDYLVVNVSSPNTPGLRSLQARDAMGRIVTAVQEARARACPTGRLPPILVKLAPDLDDAALGDAGEVALATGLDGLVMGNTTTTRPATLGDPRRDETGGLSGAPLMAASTERLAALSRITSGRVPLVGSGGVSSGADAYAKIRAGASLVQFYSALVFEGPGLVGRMKRDLAACLRGDGFASVAAAIGADVR